MKCIRFSKLLKIGVKDHSNHIFKSIEPKILEKKILGERFPFLNSTTFLKINHNTTRIINKTETPFRI